jgi:hypothetical protein
MQQKQDAYGIEKYLKSNMKETPQSINPNKRRFFKSQLDKV